MKFSVIIVNYNTRRLVEQCLDYLLMLRDSNDLEIIVVDNCSTDDSLSFLRNQKITLHENSKNYGFGYACNQGASRATGEILFFLNSDTKINSQIFEITKNIFISHLDIGILSPRILSPEGSIEIFSYGYFPTLWRTLTRQISYQINFSDNPLSDVDWVSGAAMFIRKEIFQVLGGFDKNFFMYFEDIDLCYRVHHLGLRVAIMNQVEITHLRGQSLDSNVLRKSYYFISQDSYYKKNFGRFHLFLLQLFRWPYRFIKNK